MLIIYAIDKIARLVYDGTLKVKNKNLSLCSILALLRIHYTVIIAQQLK